jgi:hypothetical protein
MTRPHCHSIEAIRFGPHRQVLCTCSAVITADDDARLSEAYGEHVTGRPRRKSGPPLGSHLAVPRRTLEKRQIRTQREQPGDGFPRHEAHGGDTAPGSKPEPTNDRYARLGVGAASLPEWRRTP